MATESRRTAATELDCETAALLRASILPHFETSKTWAALIDVMRDKGYRLSIRGGRLCLTDRENGARVCGLRFLGISMRELVARMGRLTVLPLPGDRADGEILRHPPEGTARGQV
ncbi:hypothetical protein [Primorskyibacter sp. S87]|uniref:hypothetical protein n=1 Tax=Primorskyibacter sp. S87 TaxID=3415126 RepID=UPI003C79C64C